jgi:hypothetical protein
VTARRALHAEAAQYFLRDGVRNILGPVGIGIEHHYAQRITGSPAIRSVMVVS